MSPVPPPRESRNPPDPGMDDIKTDPGLRVILDRHELNQRQLFELEQQNVKAEIKSSLTIRNSIWAGGVVVVVFIAGMTFYSKAMAQVEQKAKEAADSGTYILKEDMKLVKKELNRQGNQVDRVNKNVDLIADKLKIPDSWRPPAVPDAQVKDGGR